MCECLDQDGFPLGKVLHPNEDLQACDYRNARLLAFQIITSFESAEQMPGLMDRKSMQRIFDQLAKEGKLKLCEVVVSDKVRVCARGAMKEIKSPV